MLFRRLVEKRSKTFSLQDEQLARFLGIEIDGIPSNKMKEATYFACLRILSESISKLPLKMYRETNDGIQKATDHYLYQLLKLRPNPYMSSSTFWKVVELQRNEYGHSIVYIETAPIGRNAGRVTALWPLDMRNVQILVDNAGIISKENAIWYVFTDQKGNQYKLKNDNVLHFFGLTADGITGMAVKDYLRTIIENAQSGQQYVNNYFKGGLFAKGILTYTADISDDKVLEMKERFERVANGIKNSGKLLPLPLGFDFRPISTSMADSQFLEINQLTMQQIAAAFGIKMHQLGDLSRATHTNILEQQKQFYIETLQPILTMYEQELNYKLLTTKEREQGYFFKFNVDSILRSDLEARYKAYATGIQNGFLTPNEVRAMEEKPALEGGDDLLANGNMQRLKDIGAFYRNKLPQEGGETDGEGDQDTRE